MQRWDIGDIGDIGGKDYNLVDSIYLGVFPKDM